MSNNQNPTKEQLLEAIKRLKQNPHDKVGILGDLGITAAGAGAGIAAAALLGTTTASIPIITALTGIGMVVAAPVTLVAGAAVAGGAALYGLSTLIKDGGFQEGKRDELEREYEERLRDIEAKERCSKVKKQDLTDFYVLFEDALKLNLISNEDAYQLIQAVELGQIPLSEADMLVKKLFDNQVPQVEKTIIACPSCSQKLRAPSDLGELTLSCPKCKHSWQWVPR